MSNSKQNDAGRYFEYLIAEYLKERYGVSLTERASNDQERDQYRNESIEEKNTTNGKINSYDRKLD